MSVEIRSLARELFVNRLHDTEFEESPTKDERDEYLKDIAAACWDAAEYFDAEGKKREAAEEKSFVPPAPQKEIEK